MTESERWAKEIEERSARAKAMISPKVASRNEFDAIFGEEIERTLSEYRLMLVELLSVRRALRSFVRLFWLLTGLLALCLMSLAGLTYATWTTADQNGKLLERLSVITCSLNPDPSCE